MHYMKRCYKEDFNNSGSNSIYTNHNIEEDSNKTIVELTFALEAILMEVIPSGLKGFSITNFVAFATKYISHLQSPIGKHSSVDDSMRGWLLERQDKIHTNIIRT